MEKLLKTVEQHGTRENSTESVSCDKVCLYSAVKPSERCLATLVVATCCQYQYGLLSALVVCR